MRVRVLLFATLRDAAGERAFDLALPDGVVKVADVRRVLVDRYPGLQEHLPRAIAAVNEEFAELDDPVKDGDELAFFPPVSGGSGDELPELYRLPEEPVDHDEIVAAITTPAVGAVCLFSGMVRGETSRDGHLPQTNFLEYEAYAPMALAKMKQVAAEIRQRWPLVIGIAIAQRVGRLEVGQNTVLIACSSGHRDDGCFEAARYGIDRLKEIVPVWKKEVGPDGTAWIEGTYQPGADDKA